ncbi:MAG: hypothetical protein KFB93_05120 [Simkaniaceae bacterium]|nr:MAG: hypothetical protein KFB93_05120 [Simkaniaceae bacterium]
MSERSSSPPPSDLKGSWISTPTKQRTKSTEPYKCPSVFRKGMEYFVIHGLCIIAINGIIAVSTNYFKGRQVVPLKVAVLSAGVSAGVHHLMLDGRSCIEKRDIRREVPLMAMEKIFAIGISLLSTPFITYGCVNYLMKAEIKVLPTILLSVSGAATLFGAELFK